METIQEGPTLRKMLEGKQEMKDHIPVDCGNTLTCTIHDSHTAVAQAQKHLQEETLCTVSSETAHHRQQSVSLSAH